MTAPDLPMRERIAEVTCDIEAFGQVAFCSVHNDQPVDGKLFCPAGLENADAVLTVLADLPDTAVLAMRVADKAHQPLPFDGRSIWRCECGWEGRRYRTFQDHQHTERWGAAIAAIKEGKA